MVECQAHLLAAPASKRVENGLNLKAGGGGMGIAGEVERKGGPINLFQAWEDYSQSSVLEIVFSVEGAPVPLFVSHPLSVLW